MSLNKGDLIFDSYLLNYLQAVCDLNTSVDKVGFATTLIGGVAFLDLHKSGWGKKIT